MRQTRHLLFNLIGLFLLTGSAIAPLWAASLEQNGFTLPERLESARQAAESDPSLSEGIKQRIQEFYSQTVKWLQEGARAKADLKQLEQRVQQAPKLIKKTRAQLSHPLQNTPSVRSITRRATLEQLDFAISQEQQTLNQKREELRQQEEELARLLVGAKGISEEIVTSNNSIAEIEEDLRGPASDEPAALTEARIAALNARKQIRQTEVSSLQLQLGNLNLLTNLAQVQRDLLLATVALRQDRLDRLKQSAYELRENSAREALQEAEALREKSAELPPEIQTIAQENARYHQELEALIQKEKSVSEQLERTQRSLDEIRNDYERTRQRVDVVGSSKAIGKMLRRRQDALPSFQSYRRTSASRSEEINRATDRQIEIDELLRERSDVEGLVTLMLQGVQQDLSPAQQKRFRKQLYTLTQNRRDALNRLQTIYGRYIGQLTTLDLAERQQVDVARAFVDYIDDQLLWIPSTRLGNLFEVERLAHALLWPLTPSHWLELSRDLQELWQQQPGRLLLLLGSSLLLLIYRRSAQRQLPLLAAKTRKIRTDAFHLTLQAIALTLLIVGGPTLLMVGGGWLLSHLTTASPFTLSLANGMIQAGLTLGGLSLLRQICLTDGLGDRHLRWNPSVRSTLVSELRWLVPLILPLIFLVELSVRTNPSQPAQELSQIAFLLLMLSAFAFVFHSLSRNSPLISNLNNNKSLLAQLHFLWFPLFLLLPLALLLLSASGYHYTAVHLAARLEMTFWFFLGLFIIKELLLRSLYIAERRLRFEDALRRREELRSQRERNGEEEESPLISLEIPEVDFDQLGEQAKRLLRAGFLFGAVIGTLIIWSELLPALNFLDSVELPFQASRLIDGISKEVPVTLGDLVIGLIILVITVMAAKNLPGVLEITLLQRLPLDPGARYAITALSQYTIAGIGIFSAFSTIGLQWSSIQWLVAAMGVGLGFGLQEIVANFISGLILLFERPIRVGDVVTIDETTGVVSRIRIRATTITNYDKQEFLVPNKEFITGRLINWTLSDKINRIIITLGVAYGSDVDRAMALMTEAAQENEDVLNDPKPFCTFESFGDNALTLMLRAYLGSMENRVCTMSALHKAINHKLTQAGINIAFPQRDIHLDTNHPLQVELSRKRSDR